MRNVNTASAAVLTWTVVWFLLGYALYSVVYAAFGALASRVEDDLVQWQAPGTIPAGSASTTHFIRKAGAIGASAARAAAARDAASRCADQLRLFNAAMRAPACCVCSAVRLARSAGSRDCKVAFTSARKASSVG